MIHPDILLNSGTVARQRLGSYFLKYNGGLEST